MSRQLSKVPFNMNLDFGDDLRDFPEDHDDMRKGVEWLKEQASELLSSGKELEHAQTLSIAAAYSRTLLELTEAEEMILDAIKIAKRLENRALVLVSKIRAAQIFCWKEQYGRAESSFNELLEEIRAEGEGKPAYKLLDGVLYHYALCLIDQKQYQRASDFLSECFELRLLKGNPEQMNLCKKAMKICHEAVNQ